MSEGGAKFLKNDRTFETTWDMRKRYEAATLKCEFCGEIFNTCRLYFDHARAGHDSEVKLHWQACDECQIFFPTFQDIKIHKSKVHSKADLRDASGRLRCEFCTKSYMNMLDYNKHCHKDHYQNIKKQWISCPDCDLCFRNELGLRKHRLQRHPRNEKNKDQVLCSFCPKGFTRSETMQIHANRYHLDDVEKNWFFDPFTKTYKPTKLPEDADLYPDSKGKGFRVRRSQGPKIWCEFCSLVVTYSLIPHANSKHYDTISKIWLECEPCKMYFPTEKSLNSHKMSKHWSNNGQAKKKRTSLDKPYQCQFCDLRFSHRLRYWDHAQKNHYNEVSETWLQCDQCDCFVPDYRAMSGHLGGKHARKATCQKEFRTKCQYCSATFSRARSAIAHTVNAHKDQVGDTWPRCDECDYIGPTDQSISFHKSKLHNKLSASFVCEFCPEVLSSLKKYLDHAQTLHKKDISKSWEYCSKCEQNFPLNEHNHTECDTGSSKLCKFCSKVVAKSSYQKHCNDNHFEQISSHHNCPQRKLRKTRMANKRRLDYSLDSDEETRYSSADELIIDETFMNENNQSPDNLRTYGKFRRQGLSENSGQSISEDHLPKLDFFLGDLDIVEKDISLDGMIGNRTLIGRFDRLIDEGQNGNRMQKHERLRQNVFSSLTPLRHRNLEYYSLQNPGDDDFVKIDEELNLDDTFKAESVLPSSATPESGQSDRKQSKSTIVDFKKLAVMQSDYDNSELRGRKPKSGLLTTSRKKASYPVPVDETELKLVTSYDKNGSESKRIQCNFCAKTFINSSIYIAHANKEHSSICAADWIKCEKCGKYLPSETFLRRHEKAVHAESKNPNKRVLCNFCSKMFGDAVIFYRHVRKKHYEEALKTWVKCELCPSIMPNESAMFSHVLSAHPKYHRRMQSFLGKGPSGYERIECRCDFCGAIHGQRSRLLSHLRSKHPSELKYSLERRSCQFCQILVKGDVKLSEHFNEKHKDTIEKENWISCLKCLNKFPSETVYAIHRALDNCSFATRRKKQKMFKESSQE